jgi:[NiFe] hydrogenase assembly HybE family chaperone
MLMNRVAALEALFAHIGRTRMQGIPILHPGLRVQAVGFEPAPTVDGSPAHAAVGVLVTPWFMNLVWLPLDDAAPDALAVGATRERRVGRECFPFIGAHEDGFGAFEACSLFSPMGDFVDHDAALATARAVLDELRRPEPPQPAPPTASRRALLLGRAASTPPGALR